MKFLQELILEKKEDLSRLPEDDINAIKRNIRDGSKNLDQKWANAMELCHKAFKVEGIELPTPAMHAAWDQYEECLQFAVQQLAKHRGMTGDLADWRMSSSIFHENHGNVKKFLVHINEADNTREYTTHARKAEDLIDLIKDFDQYDTITEKKDNDLIVKYSRFGIYKNIKVTISEIN